MSNDANLRIGLIVEGKQQLRALGNELRAVASSANGLRGLAGGASVGFSGVGSVGRDPTGMQRLGVTGGRFFKDLSYGLSSYRMLVAGTVAAAGGRTIFEHTIGRADEMQRSRLMLRATLGDMRLVDQAYQRAIRLAQEIGPLTTTEAMTGMSFMVDLAGGDVERASQMVRLAKALEAIEPSQGFEGALFALRELQSGDVRSMRERFRIMGLPTRAEAEPLARAAGQSLAQFYYDALYGELNRRFGQNGDAVTSLLQAHTETVGGQMRMLVTKVQDQFALASGPAAEALNTRVREMIREFDAFMATDAGRERFAQFADSLETIAIGAANAAESFARLTASAIEFIGKHPDLAKSAGLLFLGNYLSGGGLLRLGGSALGSVGSRVFGSGKGDAASPSASEALGGGGRFGGVPVGVTPVWVVNSGAGGGRGLSSALGGGSADLTSYDPRSRRYGIPFVTPRHPGYIDPAVPLRGTELASLGRMVPRLGAAALAAFGTYQVGRLAWRTMGRVGEGTRSLRRLLGEEDPERAWMDTKAEGRGWYYNLSSALHNWSNSFIWGAERHYEAAETLTAEMKAQRLGVRLPGTEFTRDARRQNALDQLLNVARSEGQAAWGRVRLTPSGQLVGFDQESGQAFRNAAIQALMVGGRTFDPNNPLHAQALERIQRELPAGTTATVPEGADVSRLRFATSWTDAEQERFDRMETLRRHFERTPGLYSLFSSEGGARFTAIDRLVGGNFLSEDRAQKIVDQLQQGFTSNVQVEITLADVLIGMLGAGRGLFEERIREILPQQIEEIFVELYRETGNR